MNTDREALEKVTTCEDDFADRLNAIEFHPEDGESMNAFRQRIYRDVIQEYLLQAKAYELLLDEYLVPCSYCGGDRDDCDHDHVIDYQFLEVTVGQLKEQGAKMMMFCSIPGGKVMNEN